MHFSNVLAIATLAASAQAISFPSLNFGSFTRRDAPYSHHLKRGGTCPAVWNQISTDLTSLFLSGGQCNDDARAAIRAAFHDCFPDGGCDGSLAIPAELARPENAAMTSAVNSVAALALKYNVTNADMIQFAAGKHPGTNSNWTARE
jgi:manganese peroxidase